MLIPTIILAVLMSLYVLATMVYLFVHLFFPDSPVQDTSRTISILVAARNEEDKIAETLHSLAAQQYPAHKMEFHIGDDDSSDATGRIVQEFIRGRTGWFYHHITTQVNGQQGKQNVLAQLSQQATGELILVTDADIQLPPTWAAELSGALRDDVAMVSGPTVVSGRGLFAAMQRLDWLMGISIARAHSVLGIPITGVGNNLAVTRKAYDSVGGYANIPFSITEDYRLFQILCEKGPHRFVQRFHPGVLNISQPIRGIRNWLHQRKRWFKGGRDVAWYNRALLVLNGLIMPCLMLGLFLADARWVLCFYLIKVTADFVFLALAALRLRKASWLLWFPLYEIYYQLMTVVIPINQVIPSRVIWKGRRF